MGAVDLHTSDRVIGDWNDWRQLEQNIYAMTRWQQDQLCERMGWAEHYNHPSRLVNALRGEPWNTVIAAIEAVKGGDSYGY